MARVTLTKLEDFHHHYPRVVAVITTRSGGKDNAMAAAWHSPISREPPFYGVAISPKRFTYDLILQGQEFGVNFLPFERVELISQVGTAKGKETDKFAAFHIAKEKPVKTSVPLLQEAYAAYECRLVDHRTYGDHDWMVGEILAVHLEKDFFTSEGVLDLARVKPALYLGQDRYLAADLGTLRLVERH